MFSLLKRIFSKPENRTLDEPMKKILIAGLGNIGPKYEDTRHNIGFKVLDELAKEQRISFETQKLGDIAEFKIKGRRVILLKPNTYMNLSGKSVRYWVTKEKIAIENLLVVTDDINLEFGTIRLKSKGSSGGHNGLKDIEAQLKTSSYPRFRFGVGADFGKGRQVDYVLGTWNDQEKASIPERLNVATEAIKSFASIGLAQTMNSFNGK